MSDRAPDHPPRDPVLISSGGSETVPGDEAGGVRSLIDELKARVAEISAHELDLQRRENELDEKRQQLESARSAATIEQLRRIRRKLAATKEELQRRDAAVAEREAALIERETSQPAQPGHAAAPKLDELEAAIAQRRDDVDRLYQQASEVAARAQRRNAESIRMREEIEARDVELRRLEVQLATERSEVMRSATSMSAAAVPGTPPIVESVGGRQHAASWLSAAGSAITVFAVALWTQPTVFQATGRLVIDSQRDEATSVTIEHAAILADPAQLRARLPGDLAALWDARIASGDASCRAIPSPPAVELALRGDEASETNATIARIMGAYSRHVAQVPAEQWRFPKLEQWHERVAGAQRRLTEASGALAVVTQQLQAHAGYAEWISNRAELAKARETFATLTDDVRRLGAEIAGLVDGPAPRGIVTDEDVEAALRSDPTYREDSKEFASEFRKYRVETAVAMVVATEPLALLRAEVQQLESALVEQRDLQPPQSVREKIEQTLSELGAVTALTASAIQDWESRREQIERIDSPDRAADLLKLQADCVEQANRLTAALRDFGSVVGKRLDELSSSGDGGTRALVVSSLIRGHLSALAERTDKIAAAMAEVDASSNTRLDVADRQVRGLRNRISDQRDAMQQRLQEVADKQATEERRTRIDGLKADLAAAEARRDDAARDLSRRLDIVDRLEGATRDLRDLAVDRDRLETAVCDAEDELASLQAARPTAQPDVIRASTSEVVQIAGASRWTVAMILGCCAGAATVLVPFATRRTRELVAARNRRSTIASP